jgi:hypothetical protein
VCSDKNQLCIGDSGFAYCADPEKTCEEADKGSCEAVNEMISYVANKKEFLNQACAKRDDRGIFGSADECDWGERIYCPENTTRVNCLSGSQYNEENFTGCRENEEGSSQPKVVPGGGHRYNCVSGVAVTKANLICCLTKDSNGKTFTRLYEKTNDITSVYEEAYVPKCSDIKKCDQYKSDDAKSVDPCNVCQ